MDKEERLVKAGRSSDGGKRFQIEKVAAKARRGVAEQKGVKLDSDEKGQSERERSSSQ